MYEYHESLLKKNYNDAVVFLLDKYGQVTDDYFRQKSYDRFLNGEIKTITKGKFSKTSEGLYCHHIDEIFDENLSNLTFIKGNNIPFSYQKKERLVYCNLVEHAILHAIIAKETSQKQGINGFMCYLVPLIEDWYIEKIVPSSEWMKNCYEASFLDSKSAIKILTLMFDYLGLNYSERLERFKKNIDWLKRRAKIRLNENITYSQCLNNNSARSEIVMTKYHLEGYLNTFKILNERKILNDPIPFPYKSYKVVNNEMLNIIKDDILVEIHLIIDRIAEEHSLNKFEEIP